MSDRIQFGMLEGTWSGGSEPCSDVKCGRMVPDGAECFFDTGHNDDLYCKDCGQCLRFARKKEFQRNQQIKEN